MLPPSTAVERNTWSKLTHYYSTTMSFSDSMRSTVFLRLPSPWDPSELGRSSFHSLTVG